MVIRSGVVCMMYRAESLGIATASNFLLCASYFSVLHSKLVKNVVMATLADELLNDFEDSVSEGEEEQNNGFMQEPAAPTAPAPTNGAMVLDDDEEDEGNEEDEPMQNGAHPLDEEDEEGAKARVEKMQLGGVDDVRTVAGLMKTLEPVLEVCQSG